MFVALAESGSLTATAARLGVPKSTVSRSLRRLEEQMGVALVRRMARGHVLTEAGQDLALTAGPHIAALRDLSMAMGVSQSEPYGTLRVTAPVDLGHALLGPLLPAFTEKYPRVRVEVDLSLRLVDLVGEGYDVALRVVAGALPASSLIAKKLTTLSMQLYASPDYLARRGTPRAVRELGQHEIVGFMNRAAEPMVLEGRAGHFSIPVQGRISGNEFFFHREVLVAGGGIGALPAFVARPSVESGQLVGILPSHRMRGATIYFVHPPTRPTPKKTEAFRDFLFESAPPLFSPA